MGTTTDDTKSGHFMPIAHVYDPILDVETSFDSNVCKFLQHPDEGAHGP